MIRFRAFDVQFSLPLLTLIAPILAGKLGVEYGLGALALALSVHELAHLVTAKLAGVAIQEIRILPFGGSARMENPYRLPLRQILPVAAAGPASNLLLAIVLAALAHWGLLDPFSAARMIQPNLILFLFNLLPALPLDGGRILFALLRKPLGEKAALTTGLWSGRILAFLLFSIAIAGGLKQGVWNLSFVLTALFLLISGHDEKHAQFKSRAQQLSDLLSDDYNSKPARLYQMDASDNVGKAVSMLRPREPGWFILIRRGKPVGMLSSKELLTHLLNDGAPDAKLGDLLEFSFPRTQHSGAQ